VSINYSFAPKLNNKQFVVKKLNYYHDIKLSIIGLCMLEPEKIIITDDHPLFRKALLETLKEHLPDTQWLEAETGAHY
jgi:hypothetical protein